MEKVNKKGGLGICISDAEMSCASAQEMNAHLLNKRSRSRVNVHRGDTTVGFQMEKVNMKGYVFSLDIVFAIGLFIVILLAMNSYLGTPFSSQAPEASAVLAASDIVSALDKKGVFDSLDVGQIENNLSLYLPSNLNMSLKLHVYDNGLIFKETKQANLDLTENYYKGKWLLIVGNITDVKNYVLVEYKVAFR